MRFARPSFTTLIVAWAIAALMLLTVVLIPAVAGFEVTLVTGPRPETTQGQVVEVLARTTIQTGRTTIEHEEFAVAVGSQRVTVIRDRDLNEAGTLHLAPGDRVLLTKVQTPSGDQYLIVDRVRTTALVVLALAFAAMVVLTARLIGASSLLGLVCVLLVLLRYVVPGIMSGYDPVTIATTGGLVIMIVTLYLAHGANRKTSVALLGTTVSLVFTAALAVIAVEATQLTGLTSEDTAVLQVLTGARIDPAGLLLAGIIIGTLGVLDDVTIAQSSAVFELRRANLLLGPLDLYRRAMNVGRDHISATVSTLVLAYAGASLPLLMLLVVQGDSLLVQLNREFIAAEAVRTLVGSMGLIAAVPLTTLIAAFVAGHTTPEVIAEDAAQRH